MKVKELDEQSKIRSEARNKKLKDSGFEPVKAEHKQRTMRNLIKKGWLSNES